MMFGWSSSRRTLASCWASSCSRWDMPPRSTSWEGGGEAKKGSAAERGSAGENTAQPRASEGTGQEEDVRTKRNVQRRPSGTAPHGINWRTRACVRVRVWALATV